MRSNGRAFQPGSDDNDVKEDSWIHGFQIKYLAFQCYDALARLNLLQK
jgi:hypothetical protein